MRRRPLTRAEKLRTPPRWRPGAIVYTQFTTAPINLVLNGPFEVVRSQWFGDYRRAGVRKPGTAERLMWYKETDLRESLPRGGTVWSA